MRATPLKLELGPLLVVSPHPDDDVFGSGGLIASETNRGRKVRIIILTDGAASHLGHPTISAEQLIRMRQAEAQAAAECVGVPPTHMHFLDLPDGQLPRLAPALRAKAITTLTQLIVEIAPSTVVLPTRYDGSAEHNAAHAITVEALTTARCHARRLGSLVWSAYSPRLLAKIVGVAEPIRRYPIRCHRAAKARAIAAYVSQTQPLEPWTHVTLPRAFTASFRFGSEYFVDESSLHLSLIWRIGQKLRHCLLGHRCGLGKPLPTSVLDHEYTSGAWAHFHGSDELPRYNKLIEFILAVQPQPRVLDLGCGSGRLAALLPSEQLADYLGVDLSPEAVRQARELRLPSPRGQFHVADIETWRADSARFNVLVCTESLDYTADPLRTARVHAENLSSDGALVVSRHQSGNHREFWRRLEQGFATTRAECVTNAKGQAWDVRLLKLRTAKALLNSSAP